MTIHQKVKHRVFMVFYLTKMKNKHLRYENHRIQTNDAYIPTVYRNSEKNRN